MKDIARHDKDTGSSEVQISQLTAKIENLSEHIKKFKKDKHSTLGLNNHPTPRSHDAIRVIFDCNIDLHIRPHQHHGRWRGAHLSGRSRVPQLHASRATAWMPQHVHA